MLLHCKCLRTISFCFFAGNSQEYSYAPQLHIKEMIAGVEAGVATKRLADQIGVDKAVMPAMVADFVRTNGLLISLTKKVLFTTVSNSWHFLFPVLLL